MQNHIKRNLAAVAVALTVTIAFLPSSSADAPETPKIEVPIVTFHGAGVALYCTEGGSLLPEGCYPDAGSLEGTLDLGNGDVTLVFKGALGTGACVKNEGGIAVIGLLPEDQACGASIHPQDLECTADMFFWGETWWASIGGIGICTVSEVEV